MAVLKDTEQLKVHFDTLHSHYDIPPQQSYAEFFQGRRQELLEELSNLLFSKDSQSPGCLRSMRDSVKHLLQEKQDLEMEKETLQVNLQSAQELIGELRERNCYLEKKLKKKSLLKRVARHLFQKKNLPRVSRNHSGIQVVHWNQDLLDRHGDREMIDEAKNSDEDSENIDADLENVDEDSENSEEDVENIYADLENIDEDVENSEEYLENIEEDLENIEEDLENIEGDLENIDEDLENSEEDLENIKGDLENSEEDLENIDADLENNDEGVNNEKEEKAQRTSRGTEEAVTHRSAWQNFIHYIKPKKEKWSTKTPKTKTDMWRRIQSCIVKSQNSSVNNVQFQKLTASLSTDRP